MNLGNFFAELRRRHVYRIAVAYVVVAWVLIQVVTQVFPFFEVPNWAVRLVIVLLVLGFPVALSLSWAFELTPEGIKRTEDVGPNDSSLRRRGRMLTGLIIVVAFIGLGFLLFQQFRKTPAAPAPTIASHLRTVASAPVDPKSIAVLPFENLSSDKSNSYLAEGIMDEIVTDLVNVADLKVISRTSAMQYASRDRRNLGDIADELGVAHLLVGSVQRVGSQLRVTARLIDARTNTHVWAKKYDRSVNDIFSLESELAEAIVTQLRSKFSPAEKAAVAYQPTSDLDAFELYTQARDLGSDRR